MHPFKFGVINYRSMAQQIVLSYQARGFFMIVFIINRFIMSKFDQRMLRPQSNLLYFQLIPISLTKSPTTAPQLTNISFKLFKGDQLFDQTKPVPVIELTDSYSISRSYINFNVKLNDEGSGVGEFFVKVYCEGGKKGNSEGILLGSYVLRTENYVRQFTKNGIKFFKQKAQVTEGLVLIFDLYIDKTRFMLEKYVRSQKKSKKQQVNHRFQDNQEFRNSPKSERRSSRNDQNLFISPFRSLEKNRKLIVRNSAIKKYNTTIMEEDSAIYSKSFNRNEQNERRKVFLPEPFVDDQQFQIQINKSQKQSKKTKSPPSNKDTSIKKLKKKPFGPKLKQQAIEYMLNQVQKDKTKVQSPLNKILCIVFIIFAIGIMLKVMSPSRKV